MQIKAKSTLQSIAASRLHDGVAVWLGHSGRWVESVADAAAHSRETVAGLLEQIKAGDRQQQFVDPYAIDVEVRSGVTIPLHIRERMKGIGPSVRIDLGKQAERPLLSATAA
jgi:hypothetical protein